MSKPWYSIKTAAACAIAGVLAGSIAAAAPEILIYKDIGGYWWSDDPITAGRFREDLAALTGPEITVRILSMGGSVADGLGIYNALKQHPAKITTINDGVAASIASLIFMAGDIRIVASNSVTMIHAPWAGATGNAAALRDAADELDAWAVAMAASYAEASGLTKDDIIARYLDGKDHFLTADEALAEGFATQIGEAVPAAAMARASADLQARFPIINQPAAQAANLSPAAAAAITHQEHNMPGTNPPAAPVPNAADIQAIQAKAVSEALAADQVRRDAIAAAAAKYTAHAGMPELVLAMQKDPSVSVEAAGLKILAKMAEGAGPIAGGHSISTVEDEADKRKGAVVAALMVRAGVASADVKAKISGNPYRGDSLLDIAKASLERAGVDYRGRDKMEIVAAAFTQSGSDFPILLENVMHKTLQASYALAADTWRRFCAVGSVSDFRDHPRYRLAALANLQAVNELGEFVNGTIPDGEKARVRVGTKGQIINLSRQAVINDDLGSFVGLANALGRASARTIETDVYALLALNSGAGPTMDDGVALFHANHGNISTGAALSMAAIDADRVQMASQKGVGSNADYLDLRPAALLVPIGLGGTARSINSAEYDPDTANKMQKPNVVRGLFRDVVDTPRLSGTRRYLFADPAETPVLEVDFLDGNEQPFLELKNGFEVDGASWKIRHDFGVSCVDYRGAVTNAGA